MRISRAAYPALLVVLLCFVAGVATAVRSADARSTGPAATTSKVAGTLSTRVVINRFKAVGKRVVGRGTAISRYTDAAGVTSTSRKSFWLRISERVNRPRHTPKRHTRQHQRSLSAVQQLPLCHILLLEVGEVDLTLAGLHATLKAFNPDEPIQVHIQADQEGGVLGRLFCDLAAGGGALPTAQAAQSAARTMTARTQGSTILRANATVYTPDGAASSGARSMQSARSEATPNAPRAVQDECNVLHLILGPVHLDLLGLVVDINKVVLDLKGIPGTLLGDIFCQLKNDPAHAGRRHHSRGNRLDAHGHQRLFSRGQARHRTGHRRVDLHGQGRRDDAATKVLPAHDRQAFRASSEDPLCVSRRRCARSCSSRSVRST